MDEWTVRQKYNQLTADILNHQEDDDFLIATLDTADNLHQNVSKPREAQLDSQFMSTHSSLLKKTTQALNTNLEDFDPKVFAKKLLNFYALQHSGSSPFDKDKMWAKFGKDASHMFINTPSFHYIWGSFEPGQVVLTKKARKNKKDDEVAKLSKPQIMEVDDNSKDDDRTKLHAARILAILKVLYEKNNCTALCYIEFVVNPYSFSETVENIFYVSVLVKEGAVAIKEDKYHLPVIEPIASEHREEFRRHGNPSHFVFSLNMDDWEALIKEFNIRTPAIPSRDAR